MVIGGENGQSNSTTKNWGAVIRGSKGTTKKAKVTNVAYETESYFSPEGMCLLSTPLKEERTKSINKMGSTLLF